MATTIGSHNGQPSPRILPSRSALNTKHHAEVESEASQPELTYVVAGDINIPIGDKYLSGLWIPWEIRTYTAALLPSLAASLFLPDQSFSMHYARSWAFFFPSLITATQSHCLGYLLFTDLASSLKSGRIARTSSWCTSGGLLRSPEWIQRTDRTSVGQRDRLCELLKSANMRCNGYLQPKWIPRIRFWR
jgi:hypothetical protein